MDVYSFDAMTKLKEDEFRLRVLIPLLKKLGYIEVKDWHGGSAEQGKDVICWKLDELQHRRNLAIVAKAVNFGKNSARQDVCAQVAQSLNLTFLDKQTGEEQIIHDCWIVTNKNIAIGNNELLRGTLGPTTNPRVKILDGRDVWDQIVLHFPVELNQSIQAITERIGTGTFATQLILGDVQRPIARFTVGDRSVVLGEKHPGQLEREPFEVNAAFAFPDNEEGQAKARELQNAFEGKGPVSIPSEFIKRFDIPESAMEEASTLLGPIPDDFGQITITPLQPKHRMLISLEIIPDTGEPAAIPYLDMLEKIQTGDSITYTNEHQPIPSLVTLTVTPATRNVTWSVSSKPIPIAAPLYLNFLRFVEAGDHPGEASITILDPGIPWGRSRIPGRPLPEITPEMIDWIADLALIQKRTGVPIYIPDRNLLEDEVETIRFLRFILRDPVVPQTWTGGKAVFEWDLNHARDMLEAFTRPDDLRFRYVETQTVELFGTTIPLGRVERVFAHSRLENESELRLRIEQPFEGEAEFEVSLVPGSSDEAEARFLDWGALAKEEEETIETIQSSDDADASDQPAA